MRIGPGRNVWLEYERLADVVGLWQSSNGRLSRDRARDMAVRLGTELTDAELNDLYGSACGFVGDVWEYQGADAGGFWMVASGLPSAVRLVANGVRADVVERVQVARGGVEYSTTSTS